MEEPWGGRFLAIYIYDIICIYIYTLIYIYIYVYTYVCLGGAGGGCPCIFDSKEGRGHGSRLSAPATGPAACAAPSGAPSSPGRETRRECTLGSHLE